MLTTSKEQKLFLQIKNLLSDSRSFIVSQVNTTITKTYFEIGKIKVEDEQSGSSKAKYGKNTLKNLSAELTEEFGKGFSVQNLELMRKFFIVFAKSQTLSRKLSWSHYVRLLAFDDQPLKLQFYITQAELNNWSLRELNRQIESALFESEYNLIMPNESQLQKVIDKAREQVGLSWGICLQSSPSVNNLY